MSVNKKRIFATTAFGLAIYVLSLLFSRIATGLFEPGPTDFFAFSFVSSLLLVAAGVFAARFYCRFMIRMG